MRRVLVLAAAALVALALGACGQEPGQPEETAGIGDPFGELPPRELPDSIDSLARAEGWEATDRGVLAQPGDTFELVVPSEAEPATPDDGPTEIVYHLDRVEADGTLVETVDIVAVTVTGEGAPTETVTLSDEADAHYHLFAEVTRADGSFVVYQDWLYAR